MDYYTLFLLVSVGILVAAYFLVKWGIVCDCSCHDENFTFKCNDSCKCACHEDHLYKYKEKVVEYFKNLYNKIKG